MRKKQHKQQPVAETTQKSEPKLPLMEEYMQRVDAGIDRLVESQTVVPEADYLDKLCGSARRHGVSLQVDLRAGTIAVHGYPISVIGGLPGERG